VKTSVVILLALLVLVLIAFALVGIYMIEWSGALVDRLPR
jgi:hypothetical protein